ncbi:MAG: hypothetical protein IJM30_12385 [Thermoguttaceae bacterium]|nr:hypothetical protein [Thermoguttaceae bacterium]
MSTQDNANAPLNGKLGAPRLLRRRKEPFRRRGSRQSSGLGRLRSCAPFFLLIFAIANLGANALHQLTPCRCFGAAVALCCDESACEHSRDCRSTSVESDSCGCDDDSFDCPICRFFSLCRNVALTSAPCAEERVVVCDFATSTSILVGRFASFAKGRAPPRTLSL